MWDPCFNIIGDAGLSCPSKINKLIDGRVYNVVDDEGCEKEAELARVELADEQDIVCDTTNSGRGLAHQLYLQVYTQSASEQE